MALKLLEKIESQGRFLSQLWMSDEAYFHLNGKVNSKTNVFWGTQRPTEVAEKPLHSEKCTVWTAISGDHFSLRKVASNLSRYRQRTLWGKINQSQDGF